MFCDNPNLSDAEFISQLEDRLVEALKGEPIEVPNEVLESGDIIEFCRRELEKRK